MRLLAPYRLVLAVALTACAVPAWAGDLQLTLKDGRVTLVADGVTARQILEHWAKVGGTHVVNAEKLAGPPLTLRLENVSERDALDVVLRSAAGFVVAPRPVGEPGASRFDRIFILATSKAPAVSARSAPAPMRPAPFIQPPFMNGNPFNGGGTPQAVPPEQLQPYPGPFPGTGARPPTQPVQPQTSPRPGFLPVPQQPPGSVSPLPPGYPGVVPPVPPRKPGGGGGG